MYTKSLHFWRVSSNTVVGRFLDKINFNSWPFFNEVAAFLQHKSAYHRFSFLFIRHCGEDNLSNYTWTSLRKRLSRMKLCLKIFKTWFVVLKSNVKHFLYNFRLDNRNLFEIDSKFLRLTQLEHVDLVACIWCGWQEIRFETANEQKVQQKCVGWTWLEMLAIQKWRSKMLWTIQVYTHTHTHMYFKYDQLWVTAVERLWQSKQKSSCILQHGISLIYRHLTWRRSLHMRTLDVGQGQERWRWRCCTSGETSFLTTNSEFNLMEKSMRMN